MTGNVQPSLPAGSIVISEGATEKLQAPYQGHTVTLIVSKEDYEAYQAKGMKDLDAIKDYVKTKLGNEKLLDTLVGGYQELKGVSSEPKGGVSDRKIVSALIYTPDGKVVKKGEGGVNMPLTEDDFAGGKEALDAFMKSIGAVRQLAKQHLPAPHPTHKKEEEKTHTAVAPPPEEVKAKAPVVTGSPPITIEEDTTAPSITDEEAKLTQKKAKLDKLEGKLKFLEAQKESYKAALEDAPNMSLSPKHIQDLKDRQTVNDSELAKLKKAVVQEGLELVDQQNKVHNLKLDEVEKQLHEVKAAQGKVGTVEVKQKEPEPSAVPQGTLFDASKKKRIDDLLKWAKEEKRVKNEPDDLSAGLGLLFPEDAAESDDALDLFPEEAAKDTDEYLEGLGLLFPDEAKEPIPDEAKAGKEAPAVSSGAPPPKPPRKREVSGGQEPSNAAVPPKTEEEQIVKTEARKVHDENLKASLAAEIIRRNEKLKRPASPAESNTSDDGLSVSDDASIKTDE